MFGTDNNESSKAPRRRSALPSEKDGRLSPSDSPDSPADWEDEIRLNHLLRHLPDAPISSNFTARVLNQAERELQGRAAKPWWARWQLLGEPYLALRWTARAGILCALVLSGALAVHQYRISARAEVARSVAEVSRVAALPSLDVLMNFEAIQRLPEIPQNREVDVELLAALK